ncbi:hypothetical protein [Streptomyces luteireticuli]|uniref:hypothetical protein n=1 Tax=Streptomyces luteireticuli TaxID=173858 RepID=UPI0035585174
MSTHPAPVRGGSEDLASGTEPATGDSTDTAPDNVSISQHELSRLFTREKDQGRRAGVRDLLTQLNFESPKALAVFIQEQRDAQEHQRAEEQARLSEVERREQDLARREAQVAELEAAAIARERAAVRRGLLAGHGATGEDLEDAAILLDRIAGDDVEEEALTSAVEELVRRRPQLFAQQQASPPPSGSPSGGPPTRTSGSGSPARPGAFGLDMARRRGHIKDA